MEETRASAPEPQPTPQGHSRAGLLSSLSLHRMCMMRQKPPNEPSLAGDTPVHVGRGHSQPAQPWAHSSPAHRKPQHPIGSYAAR